MKTKNELEQAIVMHEEALEASRLSVEVEKTDLAQARRELADVNKPVLSAEMFDEIHEAVENAIDNFSFDDAESYDIDFELDYSNTVSVNTIEYNNTQEIVSAVVERVSALFAEKE
tara:strand:- start:432 stop:779 length:348 start_codon:yes stop_codon:yes gene_type:complete